MNTSNEELAARVAAIEFVLIQTLIIATREVKDRERFFSILRSSFDERSVKLSDRAGAVALETADRILSLAEKIYRDPPSSGN